MTRPVLEEYTIDCTHTEKLVCPWCGHESEGSGELDYAGGELYCDECGNYYEYERVKSITYKTYRTDKKPDES
jgi:transcription elongation factor Elf1